jgi:HK97 family phage prohead protease/HK97 family phage major capsid protein
MPIKPHKGESQSDFMGRCMHELGQSDTDRPQDQKVAICMDAWREAHGGEKPKGTVKQDDTSGDLGPEDCPSIDEDEEEDDYVDRCSEEMTNQYSELSDDDAQDLCQARWDQDRGEKAAKGIRHKTHAEQVQGTEFVLSDETFDRMGDTIESAGWELENFKKNPIALFNHNPHFPVGKWNDVKIDAEGKKLKSHLQLAPKGTSPRIDEIRSLIEAGILRAVSVGFRPIDSIPLNPKDPWSGMKFTKQELVEASLVSVPANPNALAVAKSLKISSETIDLVFAGQGRGTRTMRRGLTGGHAASPPRRKGKVMDGLSQRISAVEAHIVTKRDALETHLEKMDDSNVSDADLEINATLNAEIAQLEKTRQHLIDSEKLLARSSDGNGNGSGHVRSRALSTVVMPKGNGHGDSVASPAIITSRKKELDPLDYLVRAGTVAYCSKAWSRSPEETRAKIYGDDEITKVICDLVMRSASAPAMTTVTGWAAELVQPTYTDLMPLLMPKAILTRLAGKGLSLSFGTFGRIVIPTRSRTPTIAGSFVGEGLPIPVRQGAFTSQTLTPKKLAVITTWTKEMDEHSIPAIEGLLREAIQQDTSVAVDSVLIDANPATVVRPPGLLNGVAALTATAGGGIAGLVGDIKALISALVASTYGNIRNPVWLMNPGDVLSASLVSAPNTGIFPFRDEIRGGTLNTIPIIDSATVPSKTMILVDAADFVVVGGEAPRMEMSDQATLHMEDTTPLELVASPSTVAAPQRSLFQTDSLALRMVLPLNWVQRRAGTVAWTSGVTWS